MISYYVQYYQIQNQFQKYRFKKMYNKIFSHHLINPIKKILFLFFSYAVTKCIPTHPS